MGVHFSVSAASITGLYLSIKNNVEVESLLDQVGISVVSKEEPERIEPSEGFVIEKRQELPIFSDQEMMKKKNRTAELAAALSGRALALDVLLDQSELNPIVREMALKWSSAMSCCCDRPTHWSNGLSFSFSKALLGWVGQHAPMQEAATIRSIVSMMPEVASWGTQRVLILLDFYPLLQKSFMKEEAKSVWNLRMND
ncbi:hypothetical protein HHK36_031170 [Tetracentron sinense]|uniref:DUF1279 domain-containing protein n=1 Tax=Tetracentron sinense TaxID=13715 RepID=A0A835CZE5_TETSI|nr:hypothetical protein HHK36_031170 [Tetracentron sinense]